MARQVPTPSRLAKAMNPILANLPRGVAPFIDGTFTRSESERTVEVVNPSNGRPLLAIPAGCPADVERAVESARAAFNDGRWHAAAPSVRKQALHRLADGIAANATKLDALDAAEMGKPVSETRFNAAAAASLMRFYAESVDKVAGDVYTSDAQSLVMQRRVPRGVVAAIVPWNFPTLNAVLKVAPALAAGNSVVLKPSELSSASSMILAECALEAGIPHGVLNVVPGLGQGVGRPLALHADVDMVAFTGSSATGKLMLQYAGQSNMKVVLAECGGKSPHIVFADGVDFDDAAAFIARMLLTNQGQICSVGSRLLVERSIASTLVERIAAHIGQIVMGDASDPKTTFGPLACAQHYERVLRYIESAQSDGAELVSGGKKALPKSGGYFVEPALFTNVPRTARIAREEIFGPVLAVIPFENEAEAISIANETLYGLMAYLWTGNLSTAMRVCKSIRSPVRVYAAPPRGEGAGAAASIEPHGESGVGTEGGLAGLESYLRRQTLWIHHA